MNVFFAIAFTALISIIIFLLIWGFFLFGEELGTQEHMSEQLMELATNLLVLKGTSILSGLKI